MPKVYLSRHEQFNNKLVSLIYGTMKVKHISQAKIAERLDISQQAFGKKLKKAQFTYWDLFLIFETLEFEDEQILSLLRERRGA